MTYQNYNGVPCGLHMSPFYYHVLYLGPLETRLNLKKDAYKKRDNCKYGSTATSSVSAKIIGHGHE